jgi:hypothetical protein
LLTASRVYPQRIRWNPLAACRIDLVSSPQFDLLRNSWRKSGYRSIDADLAAAFQAITKDVQANDRRVVPRFSAILGEFALHKYRQKNSASKEGARGGWRIYALFDKENNVLYPVIVYPHKEWVDASDKHITECVKELLDILQQRKNQTPTQL